MGKVALPIYKDGIKPCNVFTILSNRHYVSPEMFLAMKRLSENARLYDPEFQLVYMDASFPFGKKYPLFPHISHGDGNKVDLAFVYQKSGIRTFKSKSILGYGSFEDPDPGALSQADMCREAGFWKYNLTAPLGWINRWNLELDREATQKLAHLILEDPKTYRVFLEPHLVKSLKTKHPKMRFHGCQAVRHDDHIHWEIR